LPEELGVGGSIPPGSTTIGFIMLVECIDDIGQDIAMDYGVQLDRVYVGDIYTVIGEYEVDNPLWGCFEMYLLDGIYRRCSVNGDGWAKFRFRPIHRETKSAEVKESEKV
jgi:hypothetical protein